MMKQNTLYGSEFKITDEIVIHHPTLREIICEYGEEEYFSLASYFIATSYDFMIELDDIGIDYETVSDFDLFLMRFADLKTKDTSILLKNVDLSTFDFASDNEHNDTVIWDGGNIVIDPIIHFQIAQFLRRMLHTKRNYGRMGNQEARRYIFEKERKKRNRKRSKPAGAVSSLEQCIIALVNTAEFPYTYETVLDLRLFQFYSSLKQVQKKVHCDYMMTGVFMGTVDAKGSGNKLNWMMIDGE